MKGLLQPGQRVVRRTAGAAALHSATRSPPATFRSLAVPLQQRLSPLSAMSRLQTFHLLTTEEVRNSPSRADGVPENMEARRRRLAALHMRQVCYDLRM